MKISTLLKNIIAASLFIIVSANIYWVYASVSGPGPGYANESGSNCSSCHYNGKKSLITNSSRISLSGISGGYTASTTYHMVIGFSNSSSKSGHAYGFEVTVVDSSTKKYLGKLVVSDKTNTQSTSNSTKTYIEHTSSGAKAAVGKQWKFDWTSPASSKSTIAFYVVVNSADGNGNTNNDTIHAQVFYFRPGVSLLAGFKFSPTSICAGSTISFTDTSTGGATSRLWTFKDGSKVDTSTAKNPTYKFSNSGTDSVILTVQNSTQTSTVRKAITVNALPTAIITPSKTSVCSGDSVLLTASGGSSYVWSNGASTSTIYVKDSISYTVKATNSSGCSATSAAFKLQINPLPSAPSVGVSKDTVCQGSKASFTAGSGYSSYSFTEGSTVLYLGPSNSYSNSSFAAGLHTITVSGTNSSSCSSPASKSVSVYVSALPTVSLNYNSGGKYCAGDNVILTASAGLSKYTFYNGTNVLYTGAKNTYSFAASKLKSGDNFTVEGFNSAGCNSTSSAVTSLSYAAPLHPGFTYLNNKGTVSFTDTTKGTISKVLWTFGDKTTGDTSRNPKHKYATTNSYTVTLRTYNANGCKDSFSKSLSVITAIEQPVSFSGANVFPNPVAQELNVIINSMEDQPAEIVLYDLHGHSVYSKRLQLSEGDNALNLSLTGVSNGNYILRLKGKEEIREFKIIKAE